MKVLLARVILIPLVLFIGYFLVLDQQKTRFLIDNNTELEEVNVVVSTAGTEVFDGNIVRSHSQYKFSEKTKVKIPKSDLIHVKVELPELGVYEDSYLKAKNADYIRVSVNHSSFSLNEYAVNISSFSIEDAREYRIRGLY